MTYIAPIIRESPMAIETQSTYEKPWHLRNVRAVMLDALKAAELHLHDEIAQFGARSDFADTDVLKKLQVAIDLAEKNEGL
jgi:hypothetical protein